MAIDFDTLWACVYYKTFYGRNQKARVLVTLSLLHLDRIYEGKARSLPIEGEPAKFRLRQKILIVKNTQAYFDVEKITTVRSFIAPDPCQNIFYFYQFN